jgi:hypothetical protein
LNQQICLTFFGFQITPFNLCFGFSPDFTLTTKLAGQLRKPLLCGEEFTLQIVSKAKPVLIGLHLLAHQQTL